MKTIKQTLILLFALFIFTIPVNSHPGRTDSNGGHWNRSTGEYHYHSGEYAGKKQSSSSSSLHSKSSNFLIGNETKAEKSTEIKTETPKATNQSGKIKFAFFIDSLIPLSAAVGLVCMLIASILSACKKSSRKEKLSTALGCSFYIFAMLVPLLLIFIQSIL